MAGRTACLPEVRCLLATTRVRTPVPGRLGYTTIVPGGDAPPSGSISCRNGNKNAMLALSSWTVFDVCFFSQQLSSCMLLRYVSIYYQKRSLFVIL